MRIIKPEMEPVSWCKFRTNLFFYRVFRFRKRGHYGTGLVFLPRDLADQTTALGIIKRNVQTAGLNLMYVRDVPVNNEVIGEAARNTEPVIKQLFITGDPGNMTLEQKLYVVRKKIEKEVAQSDMSDKDSFLCGQPLLSYIGI